MSGFSDALLGLLSLFPVVLILAVVAALAAKKQKERDAASGRKYTRSSGGVRGYAPTEYSREVKEIHQTDPTESYQRRMDQLRALFQNGMMERDEYEDRKADIEQDYRQGMRMR
ncbi:MAG TPA: hypothetical protein PKI76_06740 [Oscillospiraceae bacterium]|nr:hypothetical protein [Oscillospiraceae bacterium]HNW05065.1 hypothetical protein [Oscillospiraceae bacterium]